MKFESAAESDRQATTKAPVEFTKNPNAAWTHMGATAKADTALLVATEGLEAMDCTTAGITVQWTATNMLDPVEFTFPLQYTKADLISPKWKVGG